MLIGAAIALGTLGVGGAYALAAHQAASVVSADGSVTACVSGGGRVRFVQPSSSCRRSEQVVSLAAAGGAGGTTSGGGHVTADLTFVDSQGNALPGGDGPGGSFEIQDFSFGVENPTTIGSATGGAGAGKIKFNEFTIKKTVDAASPLFFKNTAAGAHYRKVVLTLRKAGGTGGSAGTPFLVYSFDTVFTTKIDWSGPGDEGPEESITFVYGKLGVKYITQTPTGPGLTVETGWDQIQNINWNPAIVVAG
jgi:type VI secretion system secreted protein Hcp